MAEVYSRQWTEYRIQILPKSDIEPQSPQRIRRLQDGMPALPDPVLSFASVVNPTSVLGIPRPRWNRRLPAPERCLQVRVVDFVRGLPILLWRRPGSRHPGRRQSFT